MHRRPTVAYPLTGGVLLAAWLLAVVLIGLAAGRLRAWPAAAVAPGGWLVAFALWAWGRTAVSPAPYEGAAELGNFFLGIGAFWAGAFFVSSARRLAEQGEPARRMPGEWAVCAFFGILAAMAAGQGIAEHLWLYPRRLTALLADPTFDLSSSINAGIVYTLRLGRVGAWFGNPNILCGFLAICVPLVGAWGLAWTGRRRVAVRLVSGGVLALMIWGAALTRSTGGLLVFCAGVLATLGMWSLWRRRSLVTASALLLVALLAAGADSGGEPGGRSLKTVRERMYYLQTGWRLLLEAPVAGHGVGGYGRLYGRERVLGAGETQFAHNFLMQLAVETGLLGLSLFGGFLFLLVRVALRGPYGGARLALGGACALFLLDSIGEYTFSFREVYLDFCLFAGCLCGGVAPRDASGAWRWRWSLPLAAVVVFPGFFMVTLPDQLGRHYQLAMDDVFAEMGAEAPARTPFLAAEAVGIADRALRWQPGNPRLLQKRAQAEAMAGQAERAAADYARAAALHPDSASIRAQWADMLWKAGRREEALQLLDQAIALYPLHSSYHVQRARYLVALGRKEEALAAGREAVRVAFQPHEREEARKALEHLGDMQER